MLTANRGKVSAMPETKAKKPTTKKTGNKKPMTAVHKAALAKGREEGRVVRSYLEALELTKPRRGRKRTPESIQKRLVAIDAALPGANALDRLHLTQEQLDLEAELAQSAETVDMTALEKDFIKSANEYGQRKGISYSAWRSIGVNTQVLQKAGITRTRG
jgi:hypothetical protein